MSASSSSTPPQYELAYFDGRGLAECARLLFAVSGTHFVDTRLTREQWNEGQKSQSPFGKMPILRVTTGCTTVVIPQSRAIERYLAKKLSLYGSTDEESALIDSFLDQILEFRMQIYNAKGDEENNKVIENELPNHFAALVRFIGVHGSANHVIGTKLTWADIALFAFSNGASLSTNQWFIKANEKFNAHPQLVAISKNVAANERIAAHVAARKPTPF